MRLGFVMFRSYLPCFKAFSFAFKIIRCSSLISRFSGSVVKLNVNNNIVVFATCVRSLQWVPKQKNNCELIRPILVNLLLETVNVKMPPSKKTASLEPNKGEHKSKHKSKRAKSKHKHKRTKSKHKHKKNKEKYIPTSSKYIKTLGELLGLNLPKVSGVNKNEVIEDCDLSVNATKERKPNCTVTSSTNTADIVVVFDSRQNSSLFAPSGKLKTLSVCCGKKNSNIPKCSEGENMLCKSNSDCTIVKPPLVDLTDDQQDTFLKTSSVWNISPFENNLKIQLPRETDNVQDKVINSISSLQWQDLSTLASGSKEVESSRAGQCVETGRYWIYSKTMMQGTSKRKTFKLMSYNVLSQSLLLEHPYLYKNNHPKALDWNFRSQLLFAEIQNLDADILCLQEVEYGHVQLFEKQLQFLGYKGIYKKRSHKRVDGVAIFYKAHVFVLQEYISVEFFQPNVYVLDRDNVALIAKFAHKDSPRESIVVATTHLLFNMNRHDVKLAQTQLLLAEVERYAYAGTGAHGPKYFPVIITGDMNFTPFSGVYKFLTEGRLRYEGLSKKKLTDGVNWRGPKLNNTLLPRRLQVTDSCQHLGILPLRQHGMPDRSQEMDLIKIQNSDIKQLKKYRQPSDWSVAIQKFTEDVENSKLLRSLVPQSDSSQPSIVNHEVKEVDIDHDSVPNDGFESGELTHPFNFQSAYTDHSEEVTTYHNSWVTVDYIFYSRPKEESEGRLTVLGTYKLPTSEEAARWGPIPNFNSPSDHYPLVVIFGLNSELQETQQ